VQTTSSTATSTAATLPTRQVLDAATYALRDNVVALNAALGALQEFKLEDDEEDTDANDDDVCAQLKQVETMARRARDLLSNRSVLRLASCVAEIAQRQNKAQVELADVFVEALSGYLLEPNPQMVAIHTHEAGPTLH
jgi:hypothetical protein